MGDFAGMITIDGAQVRLQRARTIRKARPASILDIRYGGQTKGFSVGSLGRGLVFLRVHAYE
jgi:hypothetical protein